MTFTNKFLSLAFFNIPKSEGWIRRVRKLLDQHKDLEGGVTVRILGKGAEPFLKISEEIQRF